MATRRPTPDRSKGSAAVGRRRAGRSAAERYSSPLSGRSRSEALLVPSAAARRDATPPTAVGMEVAEVAAAAAVAAAEAVADSSPDVFDLVVLSDAGGAGGAAAAALGAAALGRKAALVMEPAAPIGGEEPGAPLSGGVGAGADCCALALLRRAAAVAFDMRDARVFGWAAEAAAVAAAVGGTAGTGATAASATGEKYRHDWVALAEAARRYGVAAALRRRAQLAAAGVAVLEGHAEWAGGGQLRVRGNQPSGVGDCTLRASAFAVTPPSPPPQGAEVRGAAALLARARAPGRALVLGAAPRAVETAAALAALGAQVTLMARDSELLPGHDNQMARLMRKHLEEMVGISFRLGYQVEALGRVADGGEDRGERVRVRAVAIGAEGARIDAEYDTVLLGEEVDLTRDAARDNLRGPGWLPSRDAVGAPVYAVGSSAGEGAALARRLFGTDAMDTAPPADTPPPAPAPSIGAVRAPVVEYGFVGLSEEQAVEKLGADGIELYHSHFCPLEWALPAREPPGGGGSRCRYVKLVCARARGSGGSERVLGLHVLAPRAAEIAQGFSIALRLGASCADFLALAGLHATSAERVTAQGVAKAPTAGADAASEAAC